MARPWKHPNSGVYYFRKAVPDDLRSAFGKREVKHSLRTKDPKEAKARFAIEAARVEAELASHRQLSAPQIASSELDEDTIKRVAQAYFVHRLEEDEERRLDGFAPTDVAASLPSQPVPTFEGAKASEDEFEIGLRYNAARGLTDAFFDSEVDEVLSWDGIDIKLTPTSPSRRAIALALQAAAIRASTVIHARFKGEPVETPSYPPSVKASVRGTGAKQPLMRLFEDWWREAEAAGLKRSTQESYRNTVCNLIAFLGHDAAEEITPVDIVRFKDHRLRTVSTRTGKPTSPKTVKDSDLAALKTLFGWALSNHRLAINAAAGITIKLGKRQRLRSPGFSNIEAAALLAAADRHTRGNEKAKTFAAKRWIPWLLAYNGARVSEMGQLRKQDIQDATGRPCLYLTPEAGSIKTNEYRVVRLHAHLVEKGFLDFVAAAPDGHLFIDPSESGDVKGPLQGLTNRLGEFARKTVTDPHVSPNHGWRHRFTTLCRDAGIDQFVMKAIQGHSGDSVSDSYGDVTLTAQEVAYAKFPRQG